MSPAFFQEREKTAAKWKSSHAEAFLIPAKPRTLTHSLHPVHRPSLPLRLYSLISCAPPLPRWELSCGAPSPAPAS